MIMKSLLILGSLPYGEEREKLYNSLVETCKKFAENVSSPIDTKNFQGNEKERYERAFQKVKDADLIIGEQSEPSTGQGMEIREAANLGKPVIVIAKSGSKISGLVRGCPVVKEIIFYGDIEDLKSKLDQTLRN